jgi:hypothetical protein
MTEANEVNQLRNAAQFAAIEKQAMMQVISEHQEKNLQLRSVNIAMDKSFGELMNAKDVELKRLTELVATQAKQIAELSPRLPPEPDANPTPDTTETPPS